MVDEYNIIAVQESALTIDNSLVSNPSLWCSVAKGIPEHLVCHLCNTIDPFTSVSNRELWKLQTCATCSFKCVQCQDSTWAPTIWSYSGVVTPLDLDLQTQWKLTHKVAVPYIRTESCDFFFYSGSERIFHVFATKTTSKAGYRKYTSLALHKILVMACFKLLLLHV